MNCRTPLVSNSFSNTPISTFAYAYDELSRRTQRLDTTDSALTTNTFSYNVRSELIDATMGTNTYSYAYDPIGNRQLASANEVTNLYMANELNQYTNINAGAVEPVYDVDGNMTQFSSWQFTWDAENRLISVSSNGVSVVQNQYDYMSRRIMKSTATQTNTFLYDSWNLIQERVEFDGAVSTNQYVWGLDLSGSLQGAGGVGGLLTILSPDSCLLTPAYDANGNVTDLVDTNGAVVAHYEYDPYGNTIAQSGDQADANPYRFSSKFWDRETGFFYYGYRFYSPQMGRWLSRDSITERGGLNLYGFVNNNPVLYIDKFGLVHWGTVVQGALQMASGIMMWVAVGTSEIGSAGMATPIAIGLAVWGTANIANGLNSLIAGFNDKGPPDPLQVIVVQQTYEAIRGEPMSPMGQQITRLAVYTIDIVCACYTINLSWKTMMEKGIIWKTYPEIPMTTPSGVVVMKVESKLQFYGHVTGAGMQTFSVGLDYYGMWNSIYDLSSGAWEMIFQEDESHSQNGGGN